MDKYVDQVSVGIPRIRDSTCDFHVLFCEDFYRCACGTHDYDEWRTRTQSFEVSPINQYFLTDLGHAGTSGYHGCPRLLVHIS
jgi:hypothetical protein